MVVGDRSEEVAQAKEQLIRLGYLAPDGDPGPRDEYTRELERSVLQQPILREDACFEERVDQAQHPPVADPRANPTISAAWSISSKQMAEVPRRVLPWRRGRLAGRARAWKSLFALVQPDC
jgi:hypothetical protein